MNKVATNNNSYLRYLPNWLTLFRIAMIPVLVLTYYLPFGHIMSTAVFAIACITDWMDGYLARAMNISSPLGAFLDPVADKLLVAVALVLVLSQINYITIPVAIIISREIVISALREWMAELGNRASIAVTYVAKIKTALQMFAILFLLANQPNSSLWVVVTAYVLIYFAALLTLWTMIMYLKVTWIYLRQSI